MIPKKFFIMFHFVRLASPLRGGLHGFPGAWRRCNYKRREWNNHSSSLRLLCPSRRAVGYALHPENRTLHPVQLRFLG
ncbi:MAG: hypothetical protein WC091_13185 [Sulfuricellaceae bacterium]